MQRRLGLRVALAAAAFAASATLAPAQDNNGPNVSYWPSREINFPVPLDKIQNYTPRPTKLRFWVAPNRGRFQKAGERTLNDLDVIDSERSLKGFRHTVPRDGEYDFVLQFVFADGETQPRDDELSAQRRYMIDTRPPSISIAAYGAAGVEWNIQDENTDPEKTRLEARWQGRNAQGKDFTWEPVPLRAGSNPFSDRYTWDRDRIEQKGNGRLLEVRVYAKDRAGHDTYSRTVTLPSSGGGSGLGATGGSGFGNTDDMPKRPDLSSVATLDFNVVSRLTKVTRSGVKSAHLWVNDFKTGWKEATVQPIDNIDAGTPDPTVSIPYSVKKDGLYGFIVIPENRAGGKQDNPRPNDPAQILVEVDTEKPAVKITDIRVLPGGLTGPRVQIEWTTVEKNPLPDPITLEYCETKSGEWKKITTERVPDTKRYSWEVDDKKPWKFYIRIQAQDKAGNIGEYIWDKEVIIDLDTPSAEIHQVHTGAKGSVGRQSERPAVTPSGMNITPTAPAPFTAPVSSDPVPVTPITPPFQSTPAIPADGPFQPVPDLPRK